jgi:hypothetical protein
MSALLSVVDRAGTDNLLLVEDYLNRTAAIAAEPSRAAPSPECPSLRELRNHRTRMIRGRYLSSHKHRQQVGG